VALKSRTIPAHDAVDQSLSALAYLREAGAKQIVFKYCSTFDSTPEGNIGPVADALLAALETDFAVVCPAFPENGRTIYKGTLFVGDVPLAESSMRDHPLTPMHDSNLLRLIEVQSQYSAGLIPLQTVQAGPAAIRARIEELRRSGIKYGIVDAITDDDLRVAGAALSDQVLVTGGSGIAIGLPENHRKAGWLKTGTLPALLDVPGRDLVLAGSCSTATRA
jgi:uncharacterized protein YgbK (DUF1537 family)